jgi:hypothetical protein
MRGRLPLNLETSIRGEAACVLYPVPDGTRTLSVLVATNIPSLRDEYCNVESMLSGYGGFMQINELNSGTHLFLIPLGLNLCSLVVTQG